MMSQPSPTHQNQPHQNLVVRCRATRVEDGFGGIEFRLVVVQTSISSVVASSHAPNPLEYDKWIVRTWDSVRDNCSASLGSQGQTCYSSVSYLGSSYRGCEEGENVLTAVNVVLIEVPAIHQEQRQTFRVQK